MSGLCNEAKDTITEWVKDLREKHGDDDKKLDKRDRVILALIHCIGQHCVGYHEIREDADIEEGHKPLGEFEMN